MIRGLFTAHTGMLNEQNRLDIISNNLANAATTGYKEQGVTNQSFADLLTLKIKDSTSPVPNQKIGSMSLGVKSGETYTDFGQGSLRQTENTYDLAIEGKGFFKVSVTDSQGNETTKYTRDGSFKLTQDGYIVDSNGNCLQGESGKIQIPSNAGTVSVGLDGAIYADGTLVDTIALADFEDYNYLENYGENMFQVVEGGTETEGTGLIHQGFKEQSNVNTVSEMVQMISITRAYEANQKVIQTMDTMLEKSVNSIGRV